MTERTFFPFYSEEQKCLIQHSPTVKRKSNAYLTISPVSQQDEIEILIHFRVFFPPNGDTDRHGDVIFTVWNTHGLMQSTILPSPSSPEQNMFCS